MIAHLKGKIREASEGEVVLAIESSSASSIGYQISIPRNPTYKNITLGSILELYIYSHIREACFDLYGFLTKEEKSVFQILLQVNGIGPKAALGILSNVSYPELVQAISDGDKTFLTKVPGIGKKTAERVVIELSDKIKKEHFQMQMAPEGRRVLGDSSRAKHNEAREALAGLGFKDQDIEKMLNEVFSAAIPPRKVEDIVRAALQRGHA